VLRNPADHAIADVRSISTSEMTGGGERVPKPRAAAKPQPVPVAVAPPAPPPTPKVTLIKGVKVEEQEPASERHQKTSQPATPTGRSD
jgi:hypothetical protein